jgi:A/G-specific adenine glycosylase
MTQNLKKSFSKLLLNWNRDQNDRQMPWKGEKDPYRVWLSEIILQQTRVEQGTAYYQNFIRVFPNVHKLANAPDKEVLKLWEGLGYYSRCRNLIATAKIISKEMNGRFPDNYEDIKSLKGIGPYTAAAISSFAFDLPHAVVDGNVFRVLARLFGISKAVDSTEGKKFFTSLANELLDKKSAGLYNQAIMDFGATVCKPLNPHCSGCVFKNKCAAFANGLVAELPVKEKKVKIRNRWFYYLVIEYKNEIAIQQRNGKDIWQELYEFPLIEAEKELEKKRLLQLPGESSWLSGLHYDFVDISPLSKQQLSHQLIKGRFIKLRLSKKTDLQNLTWVKKADLEHYPFPRFINQFLQSEWGSGLLPVKRAV